MAKCEKCEYELPEEACFCPNCGTPVPKAAEFSARKTSYDGEIYKCPNCGEVLRSFCSVCPACGHEIRDSHISKTVREFTGKLEKAQSLSQKVNLIREFPIANNKEDIFEFIILASTNLNDNMPDELYNAWRAKLEQSYKKALIIFKGTGDLETIQKIYDDAQKKIRKDSLVQSAKSAKKSLTKANGTASDILTMIIYNVGVFAGIIFLFSAIITDRAGKNSSMQELIGEILLIVSASILLKRQAFLYEYFITAFGGGLSVFLSRFLKNGSMLSIGGYIVLIITVVNFYRRIMKTRPKAITTGNDDDMDVEDDSLITIPLSAFSYEGKNYGIVSSIFEHAGFTNIKTIPLHDLRRGIFRKSEELSCDHVESVYINGKSLTKLKRKFPADSAVVISYHSFQIDK